MSKYDVSVIIPVYNTEEYLRECIDSVLLQENVNVEVICVNDESPDGSLDILKELSLLNDNLSYIDQKNTGGATAINNGLTVATGEFIMILDSDDTIPSETLCALVTVSRENLSDIAVGKVIRFDEVSSEDAYDTEWITHDYGCFPEEEYSHLYQSGIYNGKLLRRSFLESHDIKLIDGLLYADRPFMYLCFYYANCVSVVDQVTHHWRQRSTRNNLSITDRKNDFKILGDRMESMEITRSLLQKESDQTRAEKHIVHAEKDNGIRPLWHLKYIRMHDLFQFYKITQGYYSKVNKKSYSDYKLEKRMIVRSLKEGWLIRYFLSAGLYTFFAKLELFMLNIKAYLKRIKTFVSKKTEQQRLLPLRLLFKKTFFKYPHNNLYKKTYKQYKSKNMVLFECNFGKIYGGMPKYLYKEIIRSRPAYNYIWVYQGKKHQHDDLINVTQVRRGSIEYYMYLAISNVWINNINFPIFHKRKNVIYLQTWHGTPIKKLGWDIEVSGPESTARMRQYYESRNWSYMLAQNDYASKIFNSAFKVNNVLVEGYPQNDIFYAENKLDVIKGVRSNLGISEDKYIILYAPTWRDTNQIGNWKFKSESAIDLLEIAVALPDDVVFLIREHHLVSPDDLSDELKDKVVDVSAWADVQELMLVSDMLITDYSSIWFDFLNTQRPVIFYLYDHDAYINKIRGLYLDVKVDLPGPVVESQSELIKVIYEMIGSPGKYSNELLQAHKKYCANDDGRVAARIVDHILPKY